jgi:hypothetical protein
MQRKSDSARKLPRTLRRAAGAHRREEERAGHLAAAEGATVPVTVVASKTEADLIIGMLRSYDVRAAVSADDVGGQEPALQGQGVRVLVAPSDATLARQLLAAIGGPLGESVA